MASSESSSATSPRTESPAASWPSSPPQSVDLAAQILGHPRQAHAEVARRVRLHLRGQATPCRTTPRAGATRRNGSHANATCAPATGAPEL